MSDPIGTGVESRYDNTDPAYDNSAETGVIQGAELEEGEDVSRGNASNPLGLTRTEGGVHISTLSDDPSGNNSMGTSAIGGFGIGSTNSNATLP